MSAVLRFATIPSLAPLAAIEIGRHLVQEGDRWFIVIPPPLPHQPQPPDSASRDRILPIGCATADGQYWAAELDRDKARISWRCSDSFRAMAAPINPVAPVTRIFMVPPSANQMPICLASLGLAGIAARPAGNAAFDPGGDCGADVSRGPFNFWKMAKRDRASRSGHGEGAARADQKKFVEDLDSGFEARSGAS